MRPSSFLEKELDQYLEGLLEHLLQRALYLVRAQNSKEVRAQTLAAMSFDCSAAAGSERVRAFLSSPLNDGSDFSDKLVSQISRLHVIGGICHQAISNEDEGNTAMQLSILAEVIKKTMLNVKDMTAPLPSVNSEGIQTH